MIRTRFFLILSVAINLFLIAFMAMHDFHNGHSGPMPDRLIHSLTHNLTKSDAAIVDQSFRTHESAFANLHDSWKENKQSLNKTLNIDPLNIDSVKALLADANNNHRRFDDLAEQSILQALPNLSADGRHQIFNGDDRR